LPSAFTGVWWQINFTDPLVIFISCRPLCPCLMLCANGLGVMYLLFLCYIFSGWYCSNSCPVG
jgi:hypothetical protein